MAGQATKIRTIAPFIQFYFLYLEPVLALGGAYVCFYDQPRFLTGTIPSSVLASSPLTISPVVEMLILNIGALYAMFAIVEGVVLRTTRKKGVWFGILGAMALSDIGHLYAAWKFDAARMMDLGSWSLEEWFNYGTLSAGTALRLLFLMGVGWS